MKTLRKGTVKPKRVKRLDNKMLIMESLYECRKAFNRYLNVMTDDEEASKHYLKVARIEYNDYVKAGGKLSFRQVVKMVHIKPKSEWSKDR